MASSNISGLLGNLNSAIGQGMASPLFALGTGLIAGAQPGANPGQQLQAAAGNQQRLQMGNYQMRMMQQQMGMLMPILQGLGGLMGAPAGSSQPTPSKQRAATRTPPTPVVGPYSAAPAGAAPGSSAVSPGGSMPTGASASAQGAGGMNPINLARFGLLASVLPMTQPLGKAAMQAAQIAMQTNPQLASTMAAAKSTLAQDRLMYSQAQQRGDQLGMRAARMKYLKDAGLVNVAAYNGAVTTMGGLTPGEVGASTINPIQGVQTQNGVESAIPGAPQTQQILAGAKALGAARGKTVPVGGIPIPELDVLGGNAGASSATPGAPAAGGPAGAAAGQNPFLNLLRAGRYATDTAAQGAELGKTYQEGADAARTTNYALDQMMQDAKTASVGPGAPVREWVEKHFTGLAQLVGVNIAPGELNSYQELDKYGNQVAFAAARQMGSREAAQVVELQMESNPNKSLTPGAFSDLAGSMKAMNNYIIAKNAAIQQAAQTNGGNLQLAASQWTRNIDPRVWDLTLSPTMGEKWAANIGKDKIESAWQYLTPDEQQALVQNVPMSVRKQWLK